MNRVFVLTEERDAFTPVQIELRADAEADLTVFSDCLDLIEQYLARFAPLIVLDVDFLGEQTFQLIRIFHLLNRPTQIVLVVSKDKLDICTSALSLGAVSYQLKPILTRNFVRFLEFTLKSSKTHH